MDLTTEEKKTGGRKDCDGKRSGGWMAALTALLRQSLRYWQEDRYVVVLALWKRRRKSRKSVFIEKEKRLSGRKREM
jgi:hypothetical protein